MKEKNAKETKSTIWAICWAVAVAIFMVAVLYTAVYVGKKSPEEAILETANTVAIAGMLLALLGIYDPVAAILGGILGLIMASNVLPIGHSAVASDPIKDILTVAWIFLLIGRVFIDNPGENRRFKNPALLIPIFFGETAFVFAIVYWRIKFG